MRAVVTGAAGFIGSHVAERLLERGHTVLAIDDLSGGFADNVPPGAKLECRSVLDPLDELFRCFRPRVVYHLAAYAAEGLSYHIPVFNYQNNVVGTVNVLAAAFRARAEHFVFTSSIAAYGHPRGNESFDEESPCIPCDPYGAAKLACEHHIRAFEQYYGGPSYTIFRPHNVFGPRQNIADPYRNVVGIFMASALRQEAMPIFGDGTQTRSFSYISTVAKAIADAPFLPTARNGTFNIGGDEALSVNELARLVSEVMGVPHQVAFMPARKEVAHAHCRHNLSRQAFVEAYAASLDIVSGLKRMAEYVRSRPIPCATECPAPIEIMNLLPARWSDRLRPPAAP